MPAPEVRHRYQKAVLWPKVANDAYGRPGIAEGEEISVRWTSVQREVTNAQGQTFAIDAQVDVGQRVALGSKMWLGELADWSGTGPAPDSSEVMEVVVANEVSDIRNRPIARTVYLARFRSTIPETQ